MSRHAFRVGWRDVSTTGSTSSSHEGKPPPSSYDSVGRIFFKKPRCSPGISIPAPKGDIRTENPLLSPTAYACHCSGAPFWPHQRNQHMPHPRKQILARCPHTDKAKRGNSAQPDRAFVHKERGCDRCPGHETLGIIREREGSEPYTPPPPRVTFRRVVAPLRGPGQSPALPFACCVGSLRSDGRCGRCSCWCRFRVRGAQWLVCWGCAECGGMCRLRVSGAQ